MRDRFKGNWPFDEPFSNCAVVTARTLLLGVVTEMNKIKTLRYKKKTNFFTAGQMQARNRKPKLVLRVTPHPRIVWKRSLFAIRPPFMPFSYVFYYVRNLIFVGSINNIYIVLSISRGSSVGELPPRILEVAGSDSDSYQ